MAQQSRLVISGENMNSLHTETKNTPGIFYSETLEPAPDPKISGLIGQTMEQPSVEVSVVFSLEMTSCQF